MMAERDDRYLAGGEAGGWIAPNITSDPVSGIGGWSRKELVQYLRTGRNDKAQAAGGMAEAVEHSLRFLSDDDLDAIADWLKQTPPIVTVQGTKAAYQYQGAVKAVQPGRRCMPLPAPAAIAWAAKAPTTAISLH